MKTLTTFCGYHPLEMVMHPLGIFPAEKKDDPMWCNRVSHVKDVWAMYPDLVGRVTHTKPPHPQVVSIATPAQERMKLWKETTRSSMIRMSSRRGLAATPSRLPVKAAFFYVSYSHFDYYKVCVDVSDI
jgi:hypothetical protein